MGSARARNRPAVVTTNAAVSEYYHKQYGVKVRHCYRTEAMLMTREWNLCIQTLVIY